MNEKPKRYAIYARVACSGHNSDSRILEQTRLAQDHIASLNHSGTEATIYADLGIDGYATHRPELDRLMADAAADHFDAIVCSSADRLGRGDTYEELRAAFERLGLNVIHADWFKAELFRQTFLRTKPLSLRRSCQRGRSRR